MAAAPIAVLLRRLQARPGATEEGEVLGRCEGGALSVALELGARLDAPVVAISVGPARREDRVLAVALRAGCGRAMRIDDSEVGEIDYLGVAQILAAAIRHVGARVVVAGDRSQDEGAGAVGPAIAELLDCSHLTSVRRVAVEGDALVAVRDAGDRVQRFRLQPPVVLCVQAPPAAPAAAAAAAPALDDDEAEAVPASRRAAKKRARTVPTIEEVELHDLGVEPRAVSPRRTSVGKLRQVRGKGGASLAGSPEELIERLRADRLLEPAPADPAAARRSGAGP